MYLLDSCKDANHNLVSHTGCYDSMITYLYCLLSGLESKIKAFIMLQLLDYNWIIISISTCTLYFSMQS